MSAISKFQPELLVPLWRKLTTVTIAASIWVGVYQVSSRLGVWLLSSSLREIIFEAAVRLLFAAGAGLVLGALLTFVSVPFLWVDAARREGRARQITRVLTAMVAAVSGVILLTICARWAKPVFNISTYPPAITIAVGLVYCAVVATTLIIPRTRRRVLRVLESASSPAVSRRSVLATGVSSVIVGAEWNMHPRISRAFSRGHAPKATSPNILLITFDALGAEELSSYGSSRPTSPCLATFAQTASIFDNYFSVSTLTTPCIAAMMTGRYPSEGHVVNLNDKIRGQDHRQVVPALLRDAGYRTAASISNPCAFGLVQQLEEHFDLLPDQPRRPSPLTALWRGARRLHPAGSGGFGAEMEESESLGAIVPKLAERILLSDFSKTESSFPPSLTFEQGSQLLERLGTPYFLWMHVFAPHGPYLPGAGFRGLFGKRETMRTAKQQASIKNNPEHTYPLEQQGIVDQLRIRYDEWLAEVDSSFGDFLQHAEQRRWLENTAVLISADHGESFTGGILSHASPCLSRPQIHIPLLIRLPSHTHQSRIQFTADQTSLAPTILDIAGVPRSDEMRGPSLAPWCGRNDAGANAGVAFAQFLFGNPSTGPYRTGSAGIIAEGKQYYVRLGSGQEYLRPLSEAHWGHLDKSRENPSAAKAMRERLFHRFPEIFQKAP